MKNNEKIIYHQENLTHIEQIFLKTDQYLKYYLQDPKTENPSRLKTDILAYEQIFVNFCFRQQHRQN